MIRESWLVVLVVSLSLLWRESCENPAVFCYRIACDLMTGRKHRPEQSREGLEAEGSSSNRSGNSSISSTTSRD